ncbi:hypothetical protein ACGRL8_04980 [Vibrio rumoiensis]|uniref:hypothetical protein n=1 Tax=Vibrio rumoiensis TaxID=76258 RepID=UPI003749316E
MGKSVLIPFAEQNGRLVDITQVVSGKACNCTCPSCGQSLVARKGNSERVHHFAHNKNVNEDIDEKVECKYSFYVAARLVIKQIFSEKQSDEWLLPRLKQTYEPEQQKYKNLKVLMVVSEEQQLLLENYQIELSLDKVEMDIVAEVKGVKVGIFFTYPSRPYPEIEKHKNYGVLGIDLEDLTECYREFVFKEGASFQNEIIKYVLSEGDREWLYHPREQSKEKWAIEELEERVSKFEQFEQNKVNQVGIEQVMEPTKFVSNVGQQNSVLEEMIKNREKNGNRYCPRCDYAWYVSYGETNSCPKCYLSGMECGS